MADELDPVEVEQPAPWPTGPSQWPCPGHGRGHYCTAERQPDGGFVWTCDYCGIRYRFGEGLVP